MLEFITDNLKNGLKALNINLLYEIRVRVGQPTMVNYGGKYSFLGETGIVQSKENAIVATQKQIEDIVYSAGKFSVYAVEEQMRRGFITADCGERVGLAGEYVYSKGQPLTIRDIRSVCIRVPHEIRDAAKEIFDKCLSKKLQNLLIASPPGFGKTTILRDLARLLSENTRKNILICDERGEIATGDIGITSDVIAYADKKVAFEAGIRAMRPDIIITDEITEEEIAIIKKAISSGIITIASAHFSSFEEIKASKMDIFDRFAVLDGEKMGKLRDIYTKNGELIEKNDN